MQVLSEGSSSFFLKKNINFGLENRKVCSCHTCCKEVHFLYKCHVVLGIFSKQFLSKKERQLIIVVIITRTVKSAFVYMLEHDVSGIYT